MGDMLNIQGTARNSKENRSNSSWCSSVVLRVTLNRRVHVSEDFYIERFFQENPHQHGYGCISGTRIHGSQIRTFLFLFVFILKLSICIVEKIRKILSISLFSFPVFNDKMNSKQQGKSFPLGKTNSIYFYFNDYTYSSILAICNLFICILLLHRLWQVRIWTSKRLIKRRSRISEL